ncbi:MAG TPA: carbon monoxide dehydrogenase [Rhodospirillaceae bacterium]|nr:carbon monoxide dehydrogenase [Rhodospirillaceae bacterium]|tara:strand:- start:26055 stop:28385 length:2331 start_codon:yes stop_codon:yes gene_type:complete
MEKFGIGQGVLREEDPRLLRGNGLFVNDVNLPGQAHAIVLRSPHAHADILGIDTSAASDLSGVLAIYTGEDIFADNLGVPGMPVKWLRPDGQPMKYRPQPPLALGRVRYVGDPVVLVVAETLDQAADAAEAVMVNYDPLPSITDTAKTIDKDAPRVWDDYPDNVSGLYQAGDEAATDKAFEHAHRIVKRRFTISRVFAHYLETRGAIGSYDPREDRFLLHADVQYPHRVRQLLAEKIFGVPEQNIRVMARDVGGGFGTKGWQYSEHRLVLWASRKLGRPVKWTCSRSEAVQADEHGRDNVTDAELAFDENGRVIALRVGTIANIGAYLSAIRNLLAAFTNVGTLIGVYDIPVAHAVVRTVHSNSNPTAPYRGAGRPEATYVIERMFDEAARELCIDPAELRARNFIKPEDMPVKTALGLVYDCGAFGENQMRVLEMADYKGFPERRDAARARGRLRGIGIANPIERSASPSPDFAEIRFSTDGTATILMGTKSQGQGHETVYKQIVGDRLGLDPARMRVVDGDTDRVAFGIGTMGSRSTVIGGSALYYAADKVIEKAKKVAAHMLEAAETDIEFGDGAFSVAGTDRSVRLTDVAKASFLPAKLPPGVEPGLFENATFAPDDDTYPNGSHVCEVEIDPETGETDVVGYWVVDDVGVMVNPVIVKGQIHGGVAQGVGQALGEQVAYDPDSGQLLSGSFMDYRMPRAGDFPGIEIEGNGVPTQRNPLGVKGAGEAGTVGALPATMNAVMNALAEVGVTDLDMPATPSSIWQAIEAASAD